MVLRPQRKIIRAKLLVVCDEKGNVSLISTRREGEKKVSLYVCKSLDEIAFKLQMDHHVVIPFH